MTTSRRQRIDSTAAAVATIAAANRDLSPPAHVKIRRGDLPFWEDVIAEKPKSEWSDADLVIAANLARALADSERIAQMTTAKNGVVAAKLILATIEASDKLARRIVTLRRALGLDNRSKHGEQRDVNKRREQAKDYEAGQIPTDDDDDGLLARPGTLQ